MESAMNIDDDTLTQTTCDLKLLIGDDMKYDQGKPIAGVLYEGFPLALLAVAEISTFGANKYRRGSWATVPNAIERYTDAMHRHLLMEQSGETVDQESNLYHAAHAAWGALCRLELILREIKDDGKD